MEEKVEKRRRKRDKGEGMCQYVRAKFRNVTKDRTKQWGPVQE